MKNFMLVGLIVCLGFAGISKAEETLNGVKEITNKQKKKVESNNLLIGTEIRQYRYSEPGFVSHEGLLYGIWGEWYWTSALGDGKVYGNLLYGALFYDGRLCDLSANCTAYTSTTNDYIAKINTRLEYNLNKYFYIFAGGGYRFLYDRGEGTGFYTRTGNWVYLPLGGGFKQGKILLDFEFDLIVYGSLKSNLSEVSSVYADLTHAQKGYGLVLAAGYEFNASWNVYGIYESWSLDESDPIASGGLLFSEPKNSSQSYGLRLGYLF